MLNGSCDEMCGCRCRGLACELKVMFDDEIGSELTDECLCCLC